MNKGRESWESELSALPGTAVAGVTEAATEAPKAEFRRGARGVKGRSASETQRLCCATGTKDAAVAVAFSTCSHSAVTGTKQ